MPHFHRSIRLSPLDPINFNNYVGLGAAYLVIGDYSNGADYFAHGLRERPNANWIRRPLATCLSGAGRMDEAQAVADELMRNQPDFTIARYVESMPFPSRINKDIIAHLGRLGLPLGDLPPGMSGD